MNITPRNVPLDLTDYYRNVIEINELTSPLYSVKNDTLNGLIKLISTTAIVVDVNLDGYSQRFCYQSHQQALAAHCAWYKKSFDPYFLPRGWIACRGVSKQDLIDGYPSEYGQKLIKAYCYLFECEPRFHSDVVAKKAELAKEMRCSQNNVEHLAAYLQCIDLLT